MTRTKIWTLPVYRVMRFALTVFAFPPSRLYPGSQGNIKVMTLEAAEYFRGKFMQEAAPLA